MENGGIMDLKKIGGVDVDKNIIGNLDNQTYRNYNELQKKAGFDLSAYKGSKAKVYTYKVLSYGPFKAQDNARLNLIVYNGRIIGGDISTVAINGVMLPLLRGQTNGETAS